MWEAIISGVFMLLKYLIEWKTKRKMSDEEFLSYIDAHQKKKSRIGQNAVDTEQALKDIEKL